MKKTITRILAFVAALVCGGAWAATTVAVWDGDFGVATKNGLTLNANNNEVLAGGSSIKITQANGVMVDGIPQNTSAFTVFVKYHGLNQTAEATQAIITARNSAGQNRVGVSLLANNDGLVGTSQVDGWEWRKDTNKGSGLAASGVFAFSHSSSGGTYVYVPDASQNVYGAPGLKYSGHNYDGVTIGGLREVTNLASATGMVIDGIAVLTGTVSQDDVNVFAWPNGASGQKSFANFLTTEWQCTAWRVNSVNDLMRYTFAGKMSGSSIADGPVDATGFHVTKHTDTDTVSVELQVVNGETKAVRVMFKVEDGRVYVKGGPVGWKSTGTPLGARFFTVAGAATSGTTTRTLATAAARADYGIYDLTATPAYVASNARVTSDQESYSDRTYTLNLPAVVGYPLGTVVNVSQIGLGSTSSTSDTDYNAQYAAKIKILDGSDVIATSSSRSGQAVDAVIGGIWFRYTFADGVDLQVGKDYTIQFVNDSDAVVSPLRLRVAKLADDLDKRSAIKISGETTWAPFTEVIGTYKTASSTIITTTNLKNYNDWWSGVTVKNGSFSSGADVFMEAEGENILASNQTYGNVFTGGPADTTLKFSGGSSTVNYGYFSIPTSFGCSSKLKGIDTESIPVTFVADTANRETNQEEENLFKNKEATFIFTGIGSFFNNVNIGASVDYQLKSHLIFDGGQNKLVLGSSQESKAMSTTGTIDNPSIFVKSGTLDYTMKDMNGWNGSRRDNSIVRVANGATLNFLPSGNSSMFMSGRLVLEPGSTTTYKTGTDANGFCVYGGAPTAADAVKAQIYVPAPTGEAKVATLAKADNSAQNFRFGRSGGTGGAAITVEDGATLEMNTPVEGGQNFSKYGAGTLKLMQAVTASGYTGTATIDAGAIEFAAGENSMKIAQRSMRGLLQVDKGATYTAQAGDVVDYGNAGSLAVYGTLNMSTYRWTMGTANKTYVYAGGLIEGTGDGYGSILDFYQNGATIYGKKVDGADEQVATISGPLNLQQDITFDVEEDMTLKITGQKRLPNNKSFTKTGSGTLELSGEWQGGTGNFYNLTISAGTIAYDLGEGNVRALCVNNFSSSGTVKVLSGTLYREVTARDLSSLNLGTIECAEGAAFEIRAKMTPAECSAKTVTFTGVPEGVSLVLVAGNEKVVLERQADGTASWTSDTVIVDGSACLYDFTFTNTVSTASGSFNKATLTIDAAVTVSYTEDGITAQSRPWMDINFENLEEFTVGVVATMPTSQRTTVVFLGDSVHAGNFGLHLATGAEANQVEINYVTATEVKNITTMKVPNASTARHVYTISKVDARQFVIYLDGIKWKTVATDYDIIVKGGGIQVGSDHGGRLKDNGLYSAATTAGGGVFNVLRVYDHILSTDEQQALARIYPYTDPHGTSSRTLTAATEDWTAMDESTPWSYKANAEAEAVEQAAATANGSVDLTVQSEADKVAVSVNLEEDVSYASFTIRGNKPVVFAKANDDSGKISATAAVTIGAPVKIVRGALDISGSPVTLLEDGRITFDYSAYDVSGIYVTKKIYLTGEMDQDDTKVTFTAPTSLPYRTAVMAYDSSLKQYILTVTPNHEDGAEVYINTSDYFDGSLDGKVNTTLEGTTKTAVFPNDTVVFAEGKTLPAWVGKPQCSKIKIAKDVTLGMGAKSDVDQSPVDLALDGKTITVAEGKTLTLDDTTRSWRFGSVTMNGPGNVLVNGAVTATAIAGNATLRLAEGATLTVDTALSNGRVVSGVDNRSVTSFADGAKIVYALSLNTSDITPTRDGLRINVEGTIAIEKNGNLLADANGVIPNATGVYVVKKNQNAIASVGVIAVDPIATQGAAKSTTPFAVPFKAIDGSDMTVAKLLNTTLLNVGDQLHVFSGNDADTGKQKYQTWTLTDANKLDPAWTVTAEGSSKADLAETTTLKVGSAAWVTTAGQIVVYGQYGAASEVTVATGVNLLGNTAMVEATPAAAEPGDVVEIPGVETYVTYPIINGKDYPVRLCKRTSTGWVGDITVEDEGNRLEGLNIKTEIRDVPITTGPSVPAGRGYFLKRPATAQLTPEP